MKKLAFVFQLFFATLATAQLQALRYEQSGGKETATYEECIGFYKALAKQFPACRLMTGDTTDAGKPLHLLIFDAKRQFSPAQWKQQNRPVVMILNGIHAGEPDGVDASMILLKEMVAGKTTVDKNVVVAFVPIYNIGGWLNRGPYSRVNQEGPVDYGFRGNSANLDLNRDFIKADSKEALAFQKLFHWLQPQVFVDTHVSDGADYQHTLTLLSTQHNKLGGLAGKYLHEQLEPALYNDLAEKKEYMIPYVNFGGAAPRFWPAFYDAPRYSCGFAALWGVIGFTTETHMLKPYPQRVNATLRFLKSLLGFVGKEAAIIVRNYRMDEAARIAATAFPLRFRLDTTRSQPVTFRGYADTMMTSTLTGRPVLRYLHDRPYTKEVKFHNFYTPADSVVVPAFYYLPQGFRRVVERLKANGAIMDRLKSDTVLTLKVRRVLSVTPGNLFEGHRRNTNLRWRDTTEQVQLFAGDHRIAGHQRAARYLAETLALQGDDGFFTWNFFDNVLSQKEGYADYRWEPAAAAYLETNPALKARFEQRKKDDPSFAASGEAQLDFIYKNSPYYEPVHMRYPVFQSFQ